MKTDYQNRNGGVKGDALDSKNKKEMAKAKETKKTTKPKATKKKEQIQFTKGVAGAYGLAYLAGDIVDADQFDKKLVDRMIKEKSAVKVK